MQTIKMVAVNKKAFAFCKYTLALLLWIAAIFRLPEAIIVAEVILLSSYILGVDKSPLVLFFDITIGKLIEEDKTLLNFKSIRFAHMSGFILCTIPLLCIYAFKAYTIGYAILVILAVLKTIGALGYCSASKFYECVICGNNCCRLGKKIRGGKC
ncbi:MAG: hypothetical protein A2Y24_02190 [Clostridiales bacterium GWE2_32_10]|nr:MAG: hypothetical protein A2Y24_02190 [Clostridiales bacterium GWE2_32_10]HBY21481.1 hypothetical protein [Clostridiales bacterium]